MTNRSIRKFVTRLFRKFGYEIRKAPSLKGNMLWMRRFLYFDRMFNLISSVDGDIVECGVGKGQSFLFLAFLASKEKKGRKLWGFDSSEGFPEPTPEDRFKYYNPKRGEWGGVRVKDIYDILEQAGIDKDFCETNIEIVKGFFDQTLKLYTGRPIALLHIDADLYSSYQTALKELFPRVIKGGVVLFDEYAESTPAGPSKAIDEYFKGTNYKILKDEISGKYYIKT